MESFILILVLRWLGAEGGDGFVGFCEFELAEVEVRKNFSFELECSC